MKLQLPGFKKKFTKVIYNLQIHYIYIYIFCICDYSQRTNICIILTRLFHWISISFLVDLGFPNYIHFEEFQFQGFILGKIFTRFSSTISNLVWNLCYSGCEIWSAKMPVKTGNAQIRDRTQEFLRIAEKAKKPFSTQNGPSSSPRSAMAMQSEFNRRASKIGFGIHQTSQKLAKLAKCA